MHAPSPPSKGKLGHADQGAWNPSPLGLHPCSQFRMIAVNTRFCSTKQFIVIGDRLGPCVLSAGWVVG